MSPRRSGPRRRRFAPGAAIAAAGVAATLLLHGGGAAGSERAAPVPDHPVWQAECGSCHLAYPPRLLPATTWRTLMQGLPRHFGVDASVEPAAATAIGAFLDANAARPGSKRAEAGTLRITQARWFRREHDEIPPATWTRASVRGPWNCAACHPGAARDTFSEHDIRIPAL